jgi:hypothetical protein
MHKYHYSNGANNPQRQANRVKYLYWFACRN